jgi:hypothetical protein
MTSDEFRASIRELDSRERDFAREVVIHVRSLLPLLRDHNLNHVADELAERLCRVDACHQDLAKLLRDNADAYLALLREGPR